MSNFTISNQLNNLIFSNDFEYVKNKNDMLLNTINNLSDSDTTEYNIKTPSSEGELSDLCDKLQLFDRNIKTPESEEEFSELYSKLQYSEFTQKFSINNALLSNNTKIILPLKSLVTIHNDTHNFIDLKLSYMWLNNPLFDNLFKLESNDILFSDISNNCYNIYQHFTLYDFIIEQKFIIGSLLNTTKLWIYSMITHIVNYTYIKSIDERNILKFRFELTKLLLKQYIIDEIKQLNIFSLNKPSYWMPEKFIDFIMSHIKIGHPIKFYNYYYIISKSTIQFDNTRLLSYDNTLIAEIYADILLNMTCFTGYIALQKYKK